MANPERILQKLDEYYKLNAKIGELFSEELSLCGKILRTVKRMLLKSGLEENVAGLITDRLWFVFRRPEELSVENIKQGLIREIAEYPDDLMQDNYGLTKGEALNYVTDDVCKQIFEVCDRFRKDMDKVKELSREISELSRAKREIFGIDWGDKITLDRIVRLIYKCIKYALED